MAFAERREELTTPIAFSASNPVPFTNGVPRDLPLSKLLLMLEGRVTISAQAVAGTWFPEAPASLIRRIELKGTKATGGGSVQLVNIRGPEAHFLTRIYEQYTPVGPGVADAAGVGGTPFPAPLSPTANGSFDFRCAFLVPIAYLFASIQDEAATILDPSIFSQLDLIVTFGAGQADLISGGTFTFALSAFGSASGSPQVRITRFAPLAVSSGFKRLINKFHVFTYSKQKNVSTVGAAFTDTKIDDLSVGNKIRAIILRQYSENASVSGLIDQAAGASLARQGDNSNPGVFRVRLKINGAEKFRMFWPDLREYNRQLYDQYSTLLPQGYAVAEFAPRGFPMAEDFDLRGFGAAGARWELFGDATGLAATDRMDILQIEQVPVEV